MNKTNDWPKAGDSIEFKGVPSVYYPMFTNIGKYAKDNLIVGEKYEITKIEIYSSWAAIWLNGHGDNFMHLQFFKY